MRQRQKHIMGNWKMQGSEASIHALLQHIVSIQPEEGVEISVFPPYVYLEKIRWELRHSKLHYGAQDVSACENGAYTGEVSAAMLKDVGCRYALVGHSERRQLFGETSPIVAEKCLRAVQAGIIPVLCVGETQEARTAHRTEEIIAGQLESALHLARKNQLLQDLNFIVAYEPVWAIGTGTSATPHEAQQVHEFIRALLGEHHEALAARTPILYGGSVKAANAAKLFAMPDIDGALIGGASLDGEEFKSICHLI